MSDVNVYVKILTVWLLLTTAPGPDQGGEFVYLGRAHEHGSQTDVGKSYPDTGTAQGRAVLADLARHPATARHVATKMARHFIAADPPPALVERLTQRFLDADGDLQEIATPLIAAPEASPPQQAHINRPP